MSNALVLKDGQIYFCFAVDTIKVQQRSLEKPKSCSPEKLIPIENRSLKSSSPKKDQIINLKSKSEEKTKQNPIENFY